MKSRIAAFGMFMMGAFVLCGFCLVISVCAHYGNWWSIFGLLALIIGFFVPAICYNYDADQNITIANMDMEISEHSYRHCRDLGWIILCFFVMVSVAVPSIVWYNNNSASNANLGWIGATLNMSGITLVWWAYVIWLRIFIFQKQPGGAGYS